MKDITKNQYREDSRAIPAAWIEKLYRADDKTAAPRKKKKADDSSQSARRAMIRRMQQKGKRAAASERTKINKSYNGARRA